MEKISDIVYNAGTFSNTNAFLPLSENALAIMEEYMKEFIDDSAKPVSMGWQWQQEPQLAKPCFDTIITSSNLQYELELTNKLYFASDTSYTDYTVGVDYGVAAPDYTAIFSYSHSMPKFKKGDKIVPNAAGKIYLRECPRICEEGGYCIVTDCKNDSVRYDVYNHNHDLRFRGAEADCYFDLFTSPSPTPTMGIVQKARDLLLSAEEKLFRKVGFKDSCGNWTREAKDVYMEHMMNKDAEAVLKPLAEELKKELDEEESTCDC